MNNGGDNAAAGRRVPSPPPPQRVWQPTNNKVNPRGVGVDAAAPAGGGRARLQHFFLLRWLVGQRPAAAACATCFAPCAHPNTI